MFLKRIFQRYACASVAFAATAFLFANCINYDDATQPARLEVQLVRPTEFINGGPISGQPVTLTGGERPLTVLSNADGRAVFEGLVPDIYTLSASWTVNQTDYTAYTGDPNVAQSYTVSGSLTHQKVEGNTAVSLPTHVSANRDIVIGKVYHSGSKDKNNRAYQAGKYVELYNQSDSTVDVAGLYLALLESGSTQAWTLDRLHEQYADSVVVAKQVFRIPTSTPVKVQPGGTVLLVNSAVNHSLASTYENDLTQADFEAKDRKAGAQNNPSTPALELVYTSLPGISQMNLVQGGPCGVVIFRTSEDVSKWTKVYQYGKTSGMQWMLLPVRYILDGVDLLKNKPTGADVSTKRLYPNIDAGYTHSESLSGGTGEVICRKVARTVNGRPLLQDTNNSRNDFKTGNTFKIRRYDL
ncbi:DUF4876 domain-containing protein [Prevotella sp. oral taxon 475]|uniref:DUF4876 domain-containing protein n=1 Tax=Prevotella sp. oral taxon 475 TaxID=712471 RepID=UPI001BAA5C0F|nr:DUF4876 domain-containing protein [Prevotella sp. oral taxon 475]QUB47387.1 DUF4876 domain-containing protein [Prevotella sp. oral taxon 475]